jgi:hypothetical protein
MGETVSGLEIFIFALFFIGSGFCLGALVFGLPHSTSDTQYMNGLSARELLTITDKFDTTNGFFITDQNGNTYRLSNGIDGYLGPATANDWHKIEIGETYLFSVRGRDATLMR